MYLRTLLAATAACLAPAAALAQTQVEGVVVTGRQLDIQPDVAGRLALSDRETPAAVASVTQEDFQRQGVRNAIEAMNAAPGVASGNIPGSVGAATVRGFYRAVNYLYDGVRMANADVGVRNWDAWSFERVEVIKGPASVTSGEGALAGAINFVPRRPELGRTGGEVLASYGRYDSVRLAGDINAPVGGTAAVRADLSYNRSSGWIEDTDSRSLAGTAAFLWRPTDRLSVTLSADYFEDELGTAYYGTPLVAAGTARDPSSVISGSAGLVLDKAIRSRNYDTLDGKVKSDATWLRARAAYDLTDDWKIVSDTSWYDADRSYRDSDDYSFNRTTGRFDRLTTFISHDHQFWSQRLQASYDGDVAGRRNRFTAGVEIGETDFFTVRRFGTTTSVDPYAPVRGLFPADTPANFSTRQDVTADVTSRALFAEDAFNLTPDLLLVAGLRYDDISLDRRVLNATSGAVQTYGQDYDPISWRVGAVYSVRPKTQLYAQFTRAATPVSGLLFLSAANATFDLTTGESYEVGIKHTALDDRLTLTASAYHIRQDKILTRDPANPALTVQGGSQVSKGVEAALDWSISDEWRVELSGTLLDAAFDKLIEAGGVNRSGNRPANVAETLADLVVTYAPESLPLTFSGIVRHSGSFFTSNANTVKADGFTVLDASVAWDASFGRVTLRGRNLANALYADWSGYSSYLVFLGQPRSVEIEFTRTF